MPLSTTGSKDAERSSSRGVDSSPGPEDDLETIEVISIPPTKTNSDRLRYSPDGSRKSDSQQTTDIKEKQTKWRKLKTGLSRSTKSLGSRLKSGAGRSHRNVVQDICILPSTALNGECFAEEEEEQDQKQEEKEVAGRRAKEGRRRGGKGGRQRRNSDDSLVFASRIDSATSSTSRTSLSPVDSSSKAVDASLVIYDADYDGQL